MINGKLYINGEFKDSIDKKTFDVTDPYTLKVIGKQADASDKDIKEAIDGAVESFKSWKKTSAYDRGKMLRKLHDMVLENEKELC